jgi:predicted aconitase with swiveling domain
MKEFKGRVLFGGTFDGEAAVTHQGFNTLASFEKSALSSNAKKVLVSDQNNKDLFKVNITGKALCLPMTVGSTTGGMVIQTVASRGLAPKAWLFSKEIDSLAASGLILANVWNKVPLIAIDQLGDDFLAAVKTGDHIVIKEDGTVQVG